MIPIVKHSSKRSTYIPRLMPPENLIDQSPYCETLCQQDLGVQGQISLTAALGVGLGTLLRPPSIPLARHWEIGLSAIVAFGKGLSGSERESQGFLGYL